MTAQGAVVCFELGEAMPTANTVLRWHHREYTKFRRRLAWEVRVALGRSMPREPYQRAKITIERVSTGSPDRDGLIGGCKPLLDVLQPASSRHPTGLGIIIDDSPAHVEVIYQAVRIPRGGTPKTIVTIQELPDGPSHSAA